MNQTSNGKSRHHLSQNIVHGPDLVWPKAGDKFVTTAHVEELIERGLAYLRAGCPVHLSGPAGTGKTTLALHLASQLGRPVMLIHGDDEFGASDLVGSEVGYRKHRTVDQYVHTVLREEETMRTMWVDNRLTTACRDGHTLVYDEFTRSRPEANNVLLSVLGEEILNLPKLRDAGEGYLKVDPAFRAIFTSNPEEYAGIHKSQDALMDRLITIRVEYLRPRDGGGHRRRAGRHFPRPGGPGGGPGAAAPPTGHRPAPAQPPRRDHDCPRGRPARRGVRCRRSGFQPDLPGRVGTRRPPAVGRLRDPSGGPARRPDRGRSRAGRKRVAAIAPAFPRGYRRTQEPPA